MKTRPSIYQFTDYRAYLKAYYQFSKEHKSGFSYRAMSQQLGFTSPNYLKLIIDGDRHIGKNGIDKIAAGLELKKLESEYFSYLVFFSKAKSEVDRNWYFGQIARLRTGKITTAIEDTQYAYYENWYNCVIRELVVGLDAETIDYGQLARRVDPSIHHKQAKQAVRLLLELHFIEIDENGKFRHSAPLINTGNEIASYAIKQYHRDMIEFGKQSIDNHSREKREISSVTVKVSDAGFNKIKKRLQEFRDELLQMVEADTSVDRVAQVNFQLFPLSSFNDSEADND